MNVEVASARSPNMSAHAARLPRSFFGRGLGSSEILSRMPVAIASRLKVDRLGFAPESSTLAVRCQRGLPEFVRAA